MTRYIIPQVEQYLICSSNPCAMSLIGDNEKYDNNPYLEDLEWENETTW